MPSSNINIVAGTCQERDLFAQNFVLIMCIDNFFCAFS